MSDTVEAQLVEASAGGSGKGRGTTSRERRRAVSAAGVNPRMR